MSIASITEAERLEIRDACLTAAQEMQLVVQDGATPRADKAMQVQPSLQAAADALSLVAESPESEALRDDLANATDPDLGAGLLGYKGRTVYDRLSDVVNVRDFLQGVPVDGVTSNQAALAAAVAAAVAAGARLYWPAGVYVSTGNIPNLHSVRHCGAGVIKRGSDLFYVEPLDSQTNRLYVAPTGVAGSDGLSSGQAVVGWQSGFDAVKNYGPVLNGNWQIIGANGTYDLSAGAQTFSTPSKNRVLVRGPGVGGHPNVPTALIDGGGNQPSYSHGFNFDGPGVRVWVQDLKFQRFTESGGGNTRIGFLGANGADVYTQNIHTFECSWAGIIIKECDASRINGGILDANGVGAYGYISDSTRSSFGYGSSSTANGPIVKKALSAGVYWSTGSQGHCDFVTFEDCAVGFLAAENARCDTVGNNYKRNVVAKRAITGACFASGGSPEVFNEGTADANTTVLEFKAYSGDIAEMSVQGSGSWQRMAFDRTNRALSGVTPTVLTTPYTVKAYRMAGVGKVCRVHVLGVFTQATAGSVVTVNFGGMALNFTVPAAATNVPFEIDASLYEAAGGYRAFGKLTQGLNATRMSQATSGFTSSADQAISVAATLANAGDSMNLYRTDVYLIG